MAALTLIAVQGTISAPDNMLYTVWTIGQIPSVLNEH